jgi:aspartate--ammonia ligase
VIYYPPFDSSLELSSMGIRVDAVALKSQLAERKALDRMKYDFHKKLLAETLPFTIGGGIGQSRVCMVLLNKTHIGEVQASQ